MKTERISKKAMTLVSAFSDAAQEFGRDERCSEAEEKAVERVYYSARAKLEKYILMLEKKAVGK